MANPPLYPPILRKDNWKAHKGIIAKVVKGETGIGRQLELLQHTFDHVDWQYWYPNLGGSLPRIKTEAELDARIKAAQNEQHQLDALRGDIQALSALCASLGAKWSRSKLVPDTTVRHVRIKMTAALDSLDQQVALVEGEYDDVRADIQRLEAATLKFLQPAIQELEKHLPTVKKNPTVTVYNAGLHNGVRGVGVVLAKQPKFKALYLKDWQDKAGDDYLDGVADGKAVLGKVTEIEAALKRLKAALAK